MNAMTPIPRNEMISRLPDVRGSYTADAPLSSLTWFRVGGPAEVLFRPADRADLMAFLAAKPTDVPVTAIGVGSNLLVRDGGVPGVVIRLGRGFSDFEVIRADGTVLIRAGAGLSDVNLSVKARDAGLSGLEFLRGVPGTVGGALRMNAGAYGAEVKDVLVSARWIDAAGRMQESSAAELGFSYRHCSAPSDAIFVDALFRTVPGDREAIDARMKEISAARNLSQPVKSSTGGSTFANPPGAKAWELIDAAGCRGLVMGDAQVSEQHCNFLINRGNATAADLEALGETVRRRVAETSGVELHWEIRRIGVGQEGGT
ncbi:MAG: UDP-N-acetylenolpyruvoylglucosamine reductase [Minwuia thermotolerans]|nr:MAG: UDP-N-acetylenolpyruvoylglucosamine reductase [Minwuia thermotolerans]